MLTWILYILCNASSQRNKIKSNEHAMMRQKKQAHDLYHKTSLIPSVKILTVPRRCFFCGLCLLFMFRVCHAVLSVRCRLEVTCWKRADLLPPCMWCFLVFLSLSDKTQENTTYKVPMWCPGSGVYLDCIDS